MYPCSVITKRVEFAKRTVLAWILGEQCFCVQSLVIQGLGRDSVGCFIELTNPFTPYELSVL